MANPRMYGSRSQERPSFMCKSRGTNARFPCSLCQKKFTKSVALKLHLRATHSRVEPETDPASQILSRRNVPIAFLTPPLENGSDPPSTNTESDPGAKATSNITQPLMSLYDAILEEVAIEEIESMIHKTADVNKPSSHDDSAPIHAAARSKSSANLALLIEHGADIEQANLYKRTPLMMACEFGSLDCVKMLVDIGANLRGKDRYGAGLIHCAMMCRVGKKVKDFKSILDTLLHHGLDINEKDNDGCTPLLSAIMSSDYVRDPEQFSKLLEYLKYLIERGARVNTESIERQRPIRVLQQRLRRMTDTVTLWDDGQQYADPGILQRYRETAECLEIMAGALRKELQNS